MIPEKIKKGDTIGVIAPSDFIEEGDLEYINASIALMEASGFNVKFGNYVFKNDLKKTSSWGILNNEYYLIDYGCNNPSSDEFYKNLMLNNA